MMFRWTDNSNIKALDRYLSSIDVWGMAFGCAVGWGALVMPGTDFLPVAGPAGTIIAMLISTVVMLVIGECFSFLIKHSTRTGGVYNYTKEAFGRDHAFVCSWFLCLSYLTVVFLNGSALFVVIRTLVGDRVQQGVHYTIAGNQVSIAEAAFSIVALVAVGVLFVIAKPVLQKLQTALAVILAAGILITALFCLPHVSVHELFASFGTLGLSKFYGISSLVILAPWAFVGFEVISFDTAHYNFPAERSGRIIVISILFAGLAYIAMTVVSIAAVPQEFSSWQEYISNINNMSGIRSVASFFAARSIMGTAGLVVMAVTAFAAILTGIIGGYRAMLRILSTMAEDKILSQRFNETTNSILFIMVLSVLISLLGRSTLTWFVDLTSFGAITAYGYTAAATYKIARIEGDRRARIAGAAATIIAAVFIVVQLIPRLAALDAMGREAFLLLSLWCLLGFIFYWRTVNETSLAEFSGLSTSGIVLFALLLYSSLMWLGKTIYMIGDAETVRAVMVKDGVIMLLIVFTGLAVMLYLQNLVRRKHEVIEREKIRAVEGSLAKSQFLFNMSHDIRTPMNAIIGYTNLAMKEDNINSVRSYLDKITSSSNQLLSLINDILEMSRIESGKVELEYAPADIPSVFEEMRTLFSEQMKQKDILFSVHADQVHHRYVWCDRKNLSRVILNLLSNAYKFTPEGGEVSASLWETGSDEYEYASYEIRVRDSGIGMSRDFVDRMFNAFERERTSTVSGIEGTGLGLAITKSIVDLMGGTIEVLTSPGSGTEMIIRLTLRTADESEVIQNGGGSDAEISRDYSSIRVLLVEDNAVNMEIANMILEQEGFMVENAENGQIAVDMVRDAEPGYYDLVLMDIQMPVMDGHTATMMIRSLDDPEKAGVPIIAMTANAFREDVEASFASGMQAHIAKPIDIPEMMKTLDKVLSDYNRR